MERTFQTILKTRSFLSVADLKGKGRSSLPEINNLILVTSICHTQNTLVFGVFCCCCCCCCWCFFLFENGPSLRSAPPPFRNFWIRHCLGTSMLKTNSELSGTCFDLMIYLVLRAFYVWLIHTVPFIKHNRWIWHQSESGAKTPSTKIKLQLFTLRSSFNVYIYITVTVIPS